MNESKDGTINSLPSDSNIVEHINPMPSPIQSKVMRHKTPLHVINENEVNENNSDTNDYAKAPFSQKFHNENNLARLSHHHHQNQQPHQNKKTTGIDLQYTESRPCENENGDSSVISENSTINENEDGNVQTRLENYNLSPQIRLGNQLFSQNRHPGPQNPRNNLGNRANTGLNVPPPALAQNQLPFNNFANISLRINQEVNLLLAGHFEFYMFSIITYIVIFLISKNKTTFFTEIIIIWVYILTQIYGVYKMPIREDNVLAQKRQKRFVLTDWVCIEIFFLGLALKVSMSTELGDSILLTPFCLPGVLNTLIFCLLRHPQRNPSRKRRHAILKRFVFWAQFLLIALKLDEAIDADWMIVLLPTKIALASLIIYCFFPLFILLSVIYMMCRGSQMMRGLSNKTQLIGFGWSFVVSLFSAFWIAILFGVEDLLEEGIDSEQIEKQLIAALVHAVALLLMTIVFRPHLKIFLKYLFELEVRTRARETRVEQTIKFEEVEPNIPYLIATSPTFHQLIEEEIKTYDLIKLNQWRKLIDRAKALKYRIKKSPRNYTALGHQTQDNKIADKVPLNKKHNASMELPIDNNNQMNNIFEHSPSRRNYTQDDMDIYEDIERPAKQEDIKENENVCYICVQKEPSAIIMGCGHSGICYECALESWRKGDKCVMCRQKIDNVLKVKFYQKLNVSKPLHGTKKVVELRG